MFAKNNPKMIPLKKKDLDVGKYILPIAELLKSDSSFSILST